METHSLEVVPTSTMTTQHSTKIIIIYFSHFAGYWWIDSCNYTSHLNGKWYPTEEVPEGGEPGIYWESWKNRNHSLKAVRMLVGRDD